jgi:hypothetical protein
LRVGRRLNPGHFGVCHGLHGPGIESIDSLTDKETVFGETCTCLLTTVSGATITVLLPITIHS